MKEKLINVEEKEITGKSGLLMLFIGIAGILLSLPCFIAPAVLGLPVPVIVLGVILGVMLVIGGILILCGLCIINPNETPLSAAF